MTRSVHITPHRRLRRPLTVVMDLTERCNLSCVMCYFAEIDRLRFPPFDRELAPQGMMPLPVFESIAADLFPRSQRVALACAAEPLLHPQFEQIVSLAGSYRIRDLWFPTNLLALSEKKAKAIVQAGVTTVAVSIDGTQRESYEKIRVGGTWRRLHTCLETLERARAGSRTRTRLIFTWMRSNFDDILALPAFAQEHGFSELDVRFCGPVPEVDTTPERLDDEDPALLRDMLGRAARDAVERGLKLAYFPDFETESDRSSNPLKAVRRKVWRLRAGLDRPEYWSAVWHKRLDGCHFPGRTVVVRPNGAISPCIFWQQAPLGLYPEQDLASVRTATREILHGLHTGKPVGTCGQCAERRDGFYLEVSQLASPSSASSERLQVARRRLAVALVMVVALLWAGFWSLREFSRLGAEGGAGMSTPTSDLGLQRPRRVSPPEAVDSPTQ